MESQNNVADWQISITQAIDKLTKKQQIIIVLKEMEGFKYEDIDRMPHKPMGTIKSQLHRTVYAVSDRAVPHISSFLPGCL